RRVASLPQAALRRRGGQGVRAPRAARAGPRRRRDRAAGRPAGRAPAARAARHVARAQADRALPAHGGDGRSARGPVGKTRRDRVVSHLFPKLLFADEAGRVFEHPELLALVRDGAGTALPGDPPVALPPHAQLATLPGRRPIGLCPRTGETVEVREVQLGKRAVRATAVAAVLPPGWTRLAVPAYRTSAIAPVLPQWAYTAAAWDPRLGHVAYA